jgi:hypothetical protein
MLALCCMLSIRANAAAPPREYYLITVYHFRTTAQEKSLDDFLENALLPAWHRKGIKKIGAFKPLTNDTAVQKTLYVITPFTDAAQAESIEESLNNDKLFQEKGKAYIQASWDQPPYDRMEKSWVKAFRFAPQMNSPRLSSPKAEHIYEFRSYEGPTELLYQNKVHMFNEGGEVPLFERLGFNAVFYGEVLLGARQPNLVYMTSFNNLEDREAHWKTFVDDPEWKTLVAKPEYQHNVSKADIILMHAAPYSDY